MFLKVNVRGSSIARYYDGLQKHHRMGMLTLRGMTKFWSCRYPLVRGSNPLCPTIYFLFLYNAVFSPMLTCSIQLLLVEWLLFHCVLHCISIHQCCWIRLLQCLFRPMCSWCFCILRLQYMHDVFGFKNGIPLYLSSVGTFEMLFAWFRGTHKNISLGCSVIDPNCYDYKINKKWKFSITLG